MTEAHYTDGSAFQGQTNYGPPPVPPHFSTDCATDVIDPPSFVWVTEHVVYGSAPPPATVPVHDDASAVFNYVGSAPGLFEVDVAALVAGRQGFRSNTWNIGTGVTAWVPFDCRLPEPTTTTSLAPTTSTTLAPTTTTMASSASTLATTTTVATTTPPTELPRTGPGYAAPLGGAGLALCVLGAMMARAVRRA